MLKSFFFTFEFHKLCQSGFYLDFFFKKLGDIFLRNFFVYTSLFFGEKYMIEHLTKFIYKICVNKTNSMFGLKKLSQSNFFIQLLSVFFYTLGLLIFLV